MALKLLTSLVFAQCPLILAERPGSETNSLAVDNGDAATHRKAAYETRPPASLVNLKELLASRVGSEADVEKKASVAAMGERVSNETVHVDVQNETAERNETIRNGSAHEVVQAKSLAEVEVLRKVKISGEIPANGEKGSFTSVDTDGNGEIDLKEFTAALENPDAGAAKTLFLKVTEEGKTDVANKAQWDKAYTEDILSQDLFKGPDTKPTADDDGRGSRSKTSGSAFLLAVFIVLLAATSNFEV